ncbi:hypothetical protein BKP64_03600 [Marinobacter salinus]|uniref:Uncharacterized protein n=1 Tax=Marinobacter salinus TaxID=1874317 RepID=A0A1D9GIA4_9GAMM|nr:hypothetical protein BKP64_03600 [Marinobacter salinus]
MVSFDLSEASEIRLVGLSRAARFYKAVKESLFIIIPSHDFYVTVESAGVVSVVHVVHTIK